MKKIYLDGAANTPLSREAYRLMRGFLKHGLGNSMSTHDFGVAMNIAVESSRATIAQLTHAAASEIFFTSGATEGNNWAIKSAALQWRAQHPVGGHIICSALEHDSVLRCCQQVATSMQMELALVVPKRENGYRLDVEDIEPLIRPDTFLICVMDVNNELGVRNNVARIAQDAALHDIATLVDCTQGMSCGGSGVAIAGRIPCATYLTCSAHKFYGPGGVGFMIARRPLEPLIIGGAQEQGLRGGTHNVAGIVGMTAALLEIQKADYTEHYQQLLHYLSVQLTKYVPGAVLNISPDQPSIASINCGSIIHSSYLAGMLDSYDVAVSAGSACDAEHDETAGEFNGSHVLIALGLTEQDIRNTIRVSFIRTTTTKDIDRLVSALRDLRDLYDLSGFTAEE